MDNLEKNDANTHKNQILEYIESPKTDKPIDETDLNSHPIENISQDIDLTNNETNIDDSSKNTILNNDSETETITTENASTTNCLALTIKEEHKLVAVKNVCLHSLKVTWKVVASTIALHILKIFF